MNRIGFYLSNALINYIHDWFRLCHLSIHISDGLDGLISMDLSNT